MQANRRVDTRPEVALRGALHRRGLRFRKDPILRIGDLQVRPDVIFRRAQVAVFLDGCFWHGCPEHGSTPSANRDYWEAKLSSNVARDARVTAALRAGGWEVVRVWEHEDPEAAAEEIAAIVRSRL
jgi:DNA mismatch endonuclease (patch repair protein)